MIFFDSLSYSAALNWLSGAEFGVLVSSIILCIGLMGEFPEHVDWRDSRWYVAAKIAVVAGVFGELLSDAALYGASNRVQAWQTEILVAAYDRAANAEIGLRNVLTPRHLSKDAWNRVAKRVCALGPQPFVYSITLSMEEGSDFPRQLGVLLIRDCKWKMNHLPPGAATYRGISDIGVTLGSGVIIAYFKGNTKFKAAAEALADALGDEQIAAAPVAFDGTNPADNKNVISVAIGTKPLFLREMPDD